MVLHFIRVPFLIRLVNHGSLRMPHVFNGGKTCKVRYEFFVYVRFFEQGWNYGIWSCTGS